MNREKFCIRVGCILFVIILLIGVLAYSFLYYGCCWYSPNPYIEKHKTQLYIGIKGNDADDRRAKMNFIYDLIDKFEKDPYWSTWKNPTDSSKVGVQVIPRIEDFLYEQTNIETSIMQAEESVYMLDTVDTFKWLNQDNTSNMLVNLWDIVTKDPDGDGKERSIYDRMSQEDRENLTVKLPNGENAIYTLPFSEDYWGIVYDKWIFEDYNLYSLDEYTGLDGIDGTDDDCLGPNGVLDDADDYTCDDGLPATWGDFKSLMFVMSKMGVVPFTWSIYSESQLNFLQAVMASYEGKENYALRYSMSGSHSTFGAIDKTNAWKLADSESTKVAITVAEHIASNSTYHSYKTHFSSQTRPAAREEFIMSTKTDNRIAFLLEQSTWERNAISTFETMKSAFGDEYDYKNREFGWMPLPRFVNSEGIFDQQNSKNTMYSGVNTSNGGWMLSANVKENIKPLALGFIEFCHSEQMMARFTELTGTIRPYEYELSQEQISNLSTFGKTMYEYKQKAQAVGSNIEKVRISTQNPLFDKAKSYFGENNEFKTHLYIGAENEKVFGDPFEVFCEEEITVDEYMAGIRAIYNQANWDANLAQYYEDYDVWLNG